MTIDVCMINADSRSRSKLSLIKNFHVTHVEHVSTFLLRKIDLHYDKIFTQHISLYRPLVSDLHDLIDKFSLLLFFFSR